MYALVDATFGLGYTLGPVLGAWLYSRGGFLTPFFVCGVALLATGIIGIFRQRASSIRGIVRVCVHV